MATALTQVDIERELTALRQLVKQLDAHDPALVSHSELVARYAARTANALGLPMARIERMMLAGTLHDVGKITLPGSILYKPGPLSEGEWELVRQHPETGAWIVSGAGFQEIARWILSHHEHFDGCGYPFGLTGDAIPMEARILAVADAYEAMTTDRIYRPSLGVDAAQAELRRCAGTQFDPDVVEAFLSDPPPVQDPPRRNGRRPH
jgi:HD-GYP domain-containing protein (c-di-GMP phosphodiesterase class II)